MGVDVSVQNLMEATTEAVNRSKSELFTPKTVQLCSLSSPSGVLARGQLDPNLLAACFGPIDEWQAALRGKGEVIVQSDID